MAFVLQDVINEIEETRSLEPLKKFKKENLIKVAAHYGITPAIGATKSHILNLIKDHCVENDIIDEVEEKPIAETAEIVRLKLDFEREERRLAREAEKALQDAQFAEAQKDREEAQKAREAAEAEAQRARDLRLAELKEARELRELELKAEQEKALLEAEKEAAAREHELKMASLGKHPPSDKASVFDHARNIRLVPPFQEKEVDKYFAHFEKVADSLNWPKESWVLLLQSVLVGKAQEIYGSLSVEQSSNYEHVKEAILKAYELVPEAYRQKFRNYLKFDSKTHVEFAREKENLFNRWCHSKEIGQDFKKLKQMVLLEEFKDKVRPDIRSHLDEQKVEELEKAAIMADDYALTHKMSSKSGNPQQKRYHGSGNRENISRNMDDRKRQGKSTENVGLVSKVEPLKPISCGHCGKPGHIITNCWKLGGKTPCEHCGRFNHKSEDCRIAKNKLQKEVKPTGLTSLKGLKVSPFNESENSKGVKVKPLIDRNNIVEKNKGIKVNPLHNDKSCIEDEISPNTESDYMENYKPFISEGVVSLVGDENSSQKVKILRDTGATQSLMLDSVLPLTENSFTGANVLISGVEMGILEVPLHEVNIKSSLINGNIVIGMRPSLPVEGISLILGNDLAGERVMVDPRVVEKPREDEETEKLAEKFPGIFPASVVTRSMKAKKEAIKEQGKEEIGLSGTFLENIDVKFEERNKEKADKALMRNESRNVKENIPEKQESESKSVISRQNLIVEQRKDKELLDLFKIALTPVEAEKVSVGYLIKDNIMMRKWSTHHVTIRPLLLLKEKWLDEDPEKISVLKYVATFKDRLFRAGQIAKRNLQESQSKMKVWYDRKVNDKTKSDSFPIPRIADCIDQIGNAKFVSTFDMLKGYWQVPLTQRAREISAFVTPSGLYQYKVMPFGMKNAPATFQRMVNKLVRDIDGCEGYIDDVVIFSDNWSDHIRQIERFFQIMREAKLTINLMKSEFGKATVKYLGHIVGQGQVRPLDAKIQTIVKFPIPTSRKELARFLGMAGYYRNFCLNFSDIAAPLTNLLSKKVKFVWTDDCQMAFDKVKLLLQKSPVLKSPDYEKPFKLIIDSSDVGTGSVLVQEASDGLDHPVSYFSKKFLKYQKNYSVVEKETLGLVLALEHFDVYLGSTPFKIKVYTDHNPLTFLKTMKNKNQRLVRWSLALQEYNLEIQHIPGSENVVADALSRCIG